MVSAPRVTIQGLSCTPVHAYTFSRTEAFEAACAPASYEDKIIGCALIDTRASKSPQVLLHQNH